MLLVESFVDKSQYRGTCYRTCGFTAVGPTQGFARSSRDFYAEHVVPKQLYLRELRPSACKLLQLLSAVSTSIPPINNHPEIPEEP